MVYSGKDIAEAVKVCLEMCTLSNAGLSDWSGAELVCLRDLAEIGIIIMIIW